MIVRIVRMAFATGKENAFRTIFETHYETILAMKGCSHLELLQDVEDPDVLITYSHWESLQDLETYRQTDFFTAVWTKTKVLFREKAVAFSMRPVV